MVTKIRTSCIILLLKPRLFSSPNPTQSFGRRHSCQDAWYSKTHSIHSSSHLGSLLSTALLELTFLQNTEVSKTSERYNLRDNTSIILYRSLPSTCPFFLIGPFIHLTNGSLCGSLHKLSEDHVVSSCKQFTPPRGGVQRRPPNMGVRGLQLQESAWLESCCIKSVWALWGP